MLKFMSEEEYLGEGFRYQMFRTFDFEIKCCLLEN